MFDLPLDWFNRTMADRIGNAVGVFEDVDSRNGFLFWRSSLRIRVQMDLSRPLRRGVRIYPDGPLSGLLIPFRYERLPELCSFCGLIGHVVRDCEQLLCSENGNNASHQYGEWLRFFGKGMILNNFVTREVGREADLETPQSQRLPIVVSPVPKRPLFGEAIAHQNQGGIHIAEPSEDRPIKSQASIPPAHYSLSGDPSASTKGKSKISDFVSMFKGVNKVSILVGGRNVQTRVRCRNCHRKLAEVAHR